MDYRKNAYQHYKKGLTVEAASKIGEAMDRVNDAPDQIAGQDYFNLVDLKQLWLDTEKYELLTDLKLLEDMHECPIPFIVRPE